ncbi:MAG: septum formation initiator family protein [Chloroflexi bacterium]|nr:septum formation initiator family protein [Chloroflexota bacterium]MBU1750480.1 septum formation initiator family protein [Chloroflexota bacterium]
MKKIESASPQTSLLRVATIAVGTLMVLFAVLFLQKAVEGQQTEAQAAALRGEIADIEQANAALETRIAYMQTEAYVERVAREELNLARPGETSYVVVPVGPRATPVSPVAAEAPARSLPDSRPPWLQWWDLFFSTQ